MANVSDAELILKLYELRTDEKMRAARDFVISQFKPAGFDDVAAVQRDFGGPQNSHWRQVLSYWEMVAGFILHDVLDPELFLDTNNEPFFIYAKFTPYLEQWAQTFGQPFMRQTAKMIETFPAMQERYTMMLARMAAQKKQAGE